MDFRAVIVAFICFVKSESKMIVVNTWGFQEANERAWKVLTEGGSALDAVEAGCRECEDRQCDGTVGWGGSPDEDGESTLDAMIMDGNTLNVGAVGCLRNIKPAVSVARAVLDHTEHSLLVGEKATQFAVRMGFTKENLTSENSQNMWEEWKQNNCQPNFWKDMPDSDSQCGPYDVQFNPSIHGNKVKWGPGHHDTIGIIAQDSQGNIAAATSTNGARFKIPGRVGDSPIPGSGGYADSDVGAAAATGDGDVMMRVLPSLIIVESLRRGDSVMAATELAISRISRKYPDFSGAVVALSKEGEVGAACYGMEYFPYYVASNGTMGSELRKVSCLQIVK